MKEERVQKENDQLYYMKVWTPAQGSDKDLEVDKDLKYIASQKLSDHDKIPPLSQYDFGIILLIISSFIARQSCTMEGIKTRQP